MKSDFQVQFGDIWKLGNHRLLCGDSTEKAMIDIFLGEIRPKLCVTDPPYGINYTSRCTRDDLYQLKMKNDHIVNWGEAFSLSRAQVLYVWFSFKSYDIVSKSVRNAGYQLKQMVIWVKEHFSLQRHLYQNLHEQCLVCIREGAQSTKLWTGDRKQVSVWKLPSVKPSNRIHPTEKPIGVYTIPILNHTHENEYVLDLFCGSGAIFKACEDTKRIGMGVELDPLQCSRIIDRAYNMGWDLSFEGNIFK